MPNIASQEYNLLSGPFRLTLWSFLSGFKLQFVEECAFSFVKEHNREKREEAIKRATKAWEVVVEKFSQPETRKLYVTALGKSIDDLRSGDVVEIKSDIDSKAISETRFAQIQRHLNQTFHLWKSLHADSPKGDVVEALSESLSPYYGVVYRADRQLDTDGNPKYNFATWVQQQELLSVRVLGLDEGQGLNPPRFCLYPTMVDSFAPRSDFRHGHRTDRVPVLDKDEDLLSLLYASSESFLDFDKQEDVVALVQRIDEKTLRNYFATHGPVDQALRNSNAIGRFTDLFFFINEVVRNVRAPGSSPFHPTGGEPIGILFISSPSLDTISGFLYALAPKSPPTDEDPKIQLCNGDLSEELYALGKCMDHVWHGLGGDIFAEQFQVAVERFRTKITGDIISAELNQRTEVYWHDTSNWGKSIFRNLSNAERYLDEPESCKKYIETARTNAYLLTLGASAQRLLVSEGRVGPIFHRSRIEEAKQAISLSYELLLHLQRYALKDLGERPLILNWVPYNEQPDVEKRLTICAGAGSFDGIFDLGKNKNLVFWSLALMREAVHNIKIAPDNRIYDRNEVFIQFHVEHTSDAIVLMIRQKHFQYTKFEVPEGIQIVNKLYGHEGAEIGKINAAPPRYKRIATTEKYESRTAYEANYELEIYFFLK